METLLIAIALAARARIHPADFELVRRAALAVTTCRGLPAIRKADTGLTGMSHALALERFAQAARNLGLVPGQSRHGYIRLPSSVTATGRPARGAYFYARPFTFDAA